MAIQTMGGYVMGAEVDGYEEGGKCGLCGFKEVREPSYRKREPQRV